MSGLAAAHRSGPIHTFEHADQLIYVHAYKALPSGWGVHVTIVGPNGGAEPQAEHIGWDKRLSCHSRDEAVSRGKEMARAFVDRRSAH